MNRECLTLSDWFDRHVKTSTIILCILTYQAYATPTITPFNPSVVPLPVDAKQLTSVGPKIECTPGTANTACTCSVNSLVPFEVFKMPPNAADPYVYYYGSQTLVAGTTYIVDVQCKDNNQGQAKSQTLYVEVQANKPFTIRNYPSDSVSVDAQTTAVGGVVYTVDYDDPEKRAVTSSMTQSPNQGLFSIGAGDGKIRVATDLRYATSSAYKLKVTATDGYNIINDFVVTVNLNNLNLPPSIDNLPLTLTVDETAPKNFEIIDMTVTDLTRYVNPMEPTCTLTTPSDITKFKISGTKIAVAYDNALDYEVKYRYTFKCTLFDGYLFSDGNDVLTIVVNDINEPPKWSASQYFCNITEGVVGGASCSLGAKLTDPEGDSYTVTVSDPNFSYDIVTNSLQWAQNYDLEITTVSEITTTLTATDSKGASSTASVQIHVYDLNDNKCQLSSSLLIYYVSESDDVKQLGSYSMIDDDITSPNNDVHLEVAAVSPASTSNFINVTRTGEIFYTNLFTYDLSGTTFKTFVRCVDGGSPQLTSFSTVQVVFTAQTTTTVTTTTSTTTKSTTTTTKGMWDYTEFKVFFGLLMGLIGLLVLLLFIAVAYYCLKNICVRPVHPPQQQVQQYRPNPQRSFPPSELSTFTRSDPPVNTRWENIAWKGDDVPGSLPKDHLYHYH
ncbi:protocadherin Fat 4 [Biomphalaria pfeifferi]|uniref:Protocadherin Fat 4 n=1 Tax=Biomphalaria pfeifferi TaxID=112525 RepID=A0AAD8C4L9_BIOPF|nr:protocadherin Fat 4 [Biomphalaria pfeifferi]